MQFPHCFRLIFVGIALSFLALGQPTPPSSAVDNDFIQKQFGSTCTLMPGPPQLKADLDGDGIEDLVVAGHCTNPLADQAEDNFTVIDPYNSFYGYGNTKITTQFASEDPATRGAWCCWSFTAPARRPGAPPPRRRNS